MRSLNHEFNLFEQVWDNHPLTLNKKLARRFHTLNNTLKGLTRGQAIGVQLTLAVE
jgi:hypothetical protein